MLTILIAILFTSIVIMVVIYNLKPTDALKGTFVYDETIKYEFNGKGYGAMYDKETKYPYNYVITNNTLKLDFKNESIKDASYTFSINNNTLQLIGGEGTIGGIYTLERESE